MATPLLAMGHCVREWQVRVECPGHGHCLSSVCVRGGHVVGGDDAAAAGPISEVN